MTFRTFTTVAALLLAAGTSVAFAADGAAVYKSSCAKCHGDTGQADSPSAKALKAPAIAGNAGIAGMSEADLIAKIKANKMHGGLKSLTDADLAAVAAYAKQLAGGK
jgi:mono/diheme cytochrome c family protein